MQCDFDYICPHCHCGYWMNEWRNLNLGLQPLLQLRASIECTFLNSEEFNGLRSHPIYSTTILLNCFTTCSTIQIFYCISVLYLLLHRQMIADFENLLNKWRSSKSAIEDAILNAIEDPNRESAWPNSDLEMKSSNY